MSDPDDDLMDDRLTRAGRAWRAGLPAPADPVLAAARTARHRRWLVPATAAAMVLVVAGVAAVIGQGGEKPPVAGPGPTAVPWADLPATHPRMPAHWAGPTNAQIYGARPCAAGDLVPGKAVGEGAAGTAYVTTRLALAPGRSSCRLDGSFGAELLDHGTPIPTSPGGAGGGRPMPVLIIRSIPAVLSVGWAVSHVCGHYDNTTIRVTLGGAAGTFDLPGFGRTTCNPGEPTTEPLETPAIQAGYSRHRVSPYDAVRVTGDLHLTARPGQTVDFTVTLVSRHDLPLSPCPDFRVALYSPVESATRTEEHSLNCAAVPYRTPAGVPYLPAAVPVAFTMQVVAPQADVPKLVWELVALPAHPAQGGSISVGPPASPGTLTGHVTMDGMTSITVRSGTVTLVGDDGSRTVARIGADGTYRASLPAGAYTLLVSTRQWNGGAIFKDRAGVTGGTTNTADISLPMK